MLVMGWNWPGEEGAAMLSAVVARMTMPSSDSILWLLGQDRLGRRVWLKST